jgi:tetratricopeptide (TPR) repeat protein
MNSWLVYMLSYALTGNPIVAGIAVLVFLYGGEAWWRGRLWKPWTIVQQWLRIRELRAHLKLNEHDGTARADLGRLLVERGQFAEARPHLEKVCAKIPNLALPAWNLGRACLGLGDYDAGRAAIDKALAIRPDIGYGQPWFDLGNFKFDREQWADAAGFFQHGLDIHSSSAEAWYKLGRCRLALGDSPGAKQAFDEAIAVHDAAPGFKRSIDRPWRWRAWWWMGKVKA